MAEQIYNWQRFWCPPDGDMNLLDGGYLSDPEEEWLLQKPHVVPFSAIQSVPCLGLLGEPGIGKSMEMLEQYWRTKREAAATGGEAIWFNLHDYQTDALLCQDVFSNADVMKWQQGTHHLHIFLDSLDEGLLSIETLATLLPSRFARFAPDLTRLSLSASRADPRNGLRFLTPSCASCGGTSRCEPTNYVRFVAKTWRRRLSNEVRYRTRS